MTLCIYEINYILDTSPGRIMYTDDDDDVTVLRTTKVCPNYEAVWDRTGPFLLQPGSNLGQWPTHT